MSANDISNGWTDYKKESPQIGMKVIIYYQYFGYDDWSYDIAALLDCGLFEIDADGVCFHISNNDCIIYWQPLPNPPQTSHS